MLYNAWRLFGLIEVKSYLKNTCKSYSYYQLQRHKTGLSFESFLTNAFMTMVLPTNVALLPVVELTNGGSKSKPLSNPGKRIRRHQYNSDELVHYRVGGHNRKGQDKHVFVKLTDILKTKVTPKKGQIH